MKKPWPWPETLDAVIAAPRHHTLILENERVRVLDTRIPRGDTVPVHTHKWPAVYYTIESGDFIRRDGEGKLIFDTRRMAGPRPASNWMEFNEPHSIENVGETDIRLISFEVKDP